MKLQWNFADAPIVLPAALAAHVEKASARDLRVLLELAASPLSFLDLEGSVRALAQRLRLGTAEIEASLAFWRGTGLLITADTADVPAAPVAAVPTPTVLSDRGLPHYSTEELSAILSRRAELSGLINDAQQAFGKVFNTSEVATVAGLVDYLGLDQEYVLLLLTHCRAMGKRSLRYVEKMAIELHDAGVHGVAELEERLHRIEQMEGAVGRIRALFGIGSRALTAKEKAMIERWVCTMRFDDEMLRYAYEITVDTKGKVSMPYTNGILERWYAEGYRTTEDVDRAVAEYRRQKSGTNSSFDVDEFFEAALRRTYGDT